MTSTITPHSADYEVKLTQDHESFRHTIRDFAEKEIRPIAFEIDRNNKIPRDLINKIAKLGVPAITYKEEYGGLGMDMLSMVIAMEELARVSGACSTVFVASHLVSEPISEWGTEQQKKQFLLPIISGDKIGAHAMTEPAAGSDVAGIRTTAKLVGGQWEITGRKMFITNGEIADTYLVFARTSPRVAGQPRHHGLSAFILDKNTPGFKVGSKIETTGLRGSHPTELIMDKARVPKENLLGKEGDGFYIGVKTYDRGRVDVAAQGVGIAQAAYEAAISYAQTRTSFDTPLIDFQQVQYKLADMAIGLHTARLLTYWAASLKDQGKEYVKAASIAKVSATEAAEKLALLAMMIHGGYGVATEYPVERYLRDSQIIKTYEGTNDIQRLTIAKQLIRELKG
ncbi:MAG TPA: acyl-CoA dehydrogenase family protein [Candidatus Binatus sp.]|nr:acyl-CoA dehydrogenase family protein [Candidatus Binatus sp.]